MKKFMSKREPKPWFSHLFFIVYMLLCTIPFLLLVSISFSNESDVLNKGFSFIPENFSTAAYDHILSDTTTLLRAYGITAISAFGGAIISIAVMAALGYTLARPHFIFKKFLSVMLIITMFFHGGLVPSFIINTQVFHLGNSIWIYLVHGMVSAYTVFVFRTFFAQIPTSLIEAAELDGASEVQLLTKVILPLSTAVIATYTFMQVVSRWNDFTVTMYYIQNTKLYTLQYLLQQILNEAKFLAELKKTMAIGEMVVMPSETLKYAMCVLASAPMMVVFPFFQRFFSKGMVVGAVKG